MEKTKKIPQRKCVGCNEHREKAQLLRVLRLTDGSIILDTTGRQNGRGAYVCKNMECLIKAEKHKGLERSFGQKIDAATYAVLREEMEAYGKA